MPDLFIRTQAARSVLSRGVPAVSLNLGAATAAVAAPMLDVRAAGAAGQGMAAIGQGISQGADKLGQLVQKQAEQINERHILEAESAMDDVRGKIAARWINEPDETKWQGIASEELSAAEGGILHESLSPDAREAVSARMVRWRSRTLGEAVVNSARRSREKLTEELGARAMRFEAAGNAEGAQAVYGHMEQQGLIGADQAEAGRQRATKAAEAKQREARENAVITIARTQGKAAAEKRIAESGADPVEQERLLSISSGIHREEVGKTADEFEEAVYSGALTVPGEVDAWKADDPRISARMREQMKAHLARKNDAVETERQRANAPENVSRLLSEISDLDPDKATDEDFMQLDLAIKALPEGYRDTPYRRLHRKWRKQEADSEPDVKPMETLGDDILDSLLRQGKFGSFDNDKEVVDKDGRPVLEADTKLPKIHTVRDQRQYQEALKAKASAGGKFLRWLKANPKATPDEVQKEIYKIIPAPTRAAMFDKLNPPPTENPPTKVEGNGAQNDLPGGGGPPENFLVPFYLPPLPNNK